MKHKYWSRRDLLKTMGFVALGTSVKPTYTGFNMQGETAILPVNPRFKKPDKPINCIVLGAGGRGNVYAGYSEHFPDEVKIVGVAEPIPFRRERFAEKYKIPAKHQWITWEHALQKKKFADALIITTPDHLHYGPAMVGLKMGYDLLLEKAIAQTWDQCKDILNQSRNSEKIVAICHVLRYTPYFRKMKEMIDSGRVGDIISVQHLEPVEHIHMSHSFVRGNWRNTAESNPMILSKSCHDTDILRWLIGKPCKKVSSFGSLKHFRADQAPPGSTERCSGGCKVESECPYSALEIYLRKKGWLWHLEIPDNEDATVLNALKTGRYGKCVYRSDNDVVDHQVMNMEFEDEITAAFSMEALTHYGGRRTRIFGTKGDIIGDNRELILTDFFSGAQETWDVSMSDAAASGHGGGDYGIMHDFVQAVNQQDPSLLTSNIEASMESHLMGFKAEESRLDGGKVVEIHL